MWLCTRARLRRSAILESWCRGRWRLGSATHRAWLSTRRTGRLKPDPPVVESPFPSQYRSRRLNCGVPEGEPGTPAWSATGPSREHVAHAAGRFRCVSARTGQRPSRHERIHAERRAGQHPSRRCRSRSSSVRQHSLRLRWAIRFTAGCPVPRALIERLVAARLAEITWRSMTVTMRDRIRRAAIAASGGRPSRGRSQGRQACLDEWGCATARRW